MFDGVDTSPMWNLAGQFALILFAIVVTTILFQLIVDKIRSFTGVTPTKEVKKTIRKKRTSKDMNSDLRYVVRGLLVLGGFYLFISYNLDWPYLFVIIVGASILPDILIRKKVKLNLKPSPNKTTSKVENPKKTTKQHNLLRSENEILTLPLNELSWREFERLCYLYYKAKGYKPKETQEGADGGVDLIIFNRHHNANVAVQIKHYKSGNQITVKEIRELRSAKTNHNCNLADFITTSSFTNEALKQADKFKINTYDKNWVESKIIKWRDQEALKRNLA